MGMFGGSSRKKGFDWGRAAIGFAGGAPAVQALNQRDALEEKQAEEEQRQELFQKVRGGLKARGYQDGDIDVIMANPENASKLITEALITRQGGADGMTVRSVDPRDGASSTESTAGWHNGDYFGGSDGQQAPSRLYQGEKVMPVEKGGYLGVYGGPQPQGGQPPAQSPSGPANEQTLRSQAAAAIQAGADPRAVSEELERMLGGAGAAASPRPFRSGLFGGR